VLSQRLFFLYSVIEVSEDKMTDNEKFKKLMSLIHALTIVVSMMNDGSNASTLKEIRDQLEELKNDIQ